MNALLEKKLPRWYDALWLLLLAIYIVAGSHLVPFHGDESTQLYMARDFYYQFVDGDLSRVLYRPWDTLSGQEATQQDLRIINGSLPKYLFGAVAHLNGYTIDQINDQWVWGAGWDYNHAEGHVPSDDILHKTRLASALLTVVGCVAIFAIGHLLYGRVASYSASLLFTLSPAILLNGRRAMMEGSLLGFSLLTVLLGLLVLRHRRWWTILLFGISAGLTVASKHTGVVTVFAVFMACGLIFLDEIVRKKQRHSLAHIGQLFVAGIIALAVFYGLNPAWWDAPITRAQEILTMRQNLLDSQRTFFGEYASIPEQLSGFWEQVMVAQPMIAETNVDQFLDQLIPSMASYQESGLAGVAIGGNLFGSILQALLCLLGIGKLWHLRRVDMPTTVYTFVWMAFTFSFTLFLTPLAWQRYYLPVFPVITLLSAGGLAWLIAILIARRRNS